MAAVAAMAVAAAATVTTTAVVVVVVAAATVVVAVVVAAVVATRRWPCLRAFRLHQNRKTCFKTRLNTNKESFCVLKYVCDVFRAVSTI